MYTYYYVKMHIFLSELLLVSTYIYCLLSIINISAKSCIGASLVVCLHADLLLQLRILKVV